MEFQTVGVDNMVEPVTVCDQASCSSLYTMEVSKLGIRQASKYMSRVMKGLQSIKVYVAVVMKNSWILLMWYTWKILALITATCGLRVRVCSITNVST